MGWMPSFEIFSENSSAPNRLFASVMAALAEGEGRVDVQVDEADVFQDPTQGNAPLPLEMHLGGSGVTGRRPVRLSTGRSDGTQRARHAGDHGEEGAQGRQLGDIGNHETKHLNSPMFCL